MSAPAAQKSQDNTASRTPDREPHQAQHLAGVTGPDAAFLNLQHTAGNRAVTRAIQGGARGGLPPVVQAVLGSHRGQPLEPGTRASMESRFGEDFSQVRVHTDAQATESATALRAKAYTVGRDIVFGEKKYSPETSQGKQLLAHELAHVIQQSRGGGPPSPSGSSVNEQSAKSAAHSVSLGKSTLSVNGSAGIGISREENPEIEKACESWVGLDIKTDEPETSFSKGKPVAPIQKRLSQYLRARQKAIIGELARAKQEGREPDFSNIPSYKTLRQKAIQDEKDLAKQEGREPDFPKIPPDLGTEIERNAAATDRDKVPFTDEDMFNKILAQRGFKSSLSVYQIEEAQKDYESKKNKLEAHPDYPIINALRRRNEKLSSQISYLKKKEKKKEGLSPEDREKLEKAEQEKKENQKRLDESPAERLRKERDAIYRKLSISQFRDYDAPPGASGSTAESKGAPAGIGERTYTIIQIIGPDNKIIDFEMAENNPKFHAEEAAVDRLIKRWVSNELSGIRIVVFTDQEVCHKAGRCRVALRTLAEAIGADTVVESHTLVAEKPGKDDKSKGNLSAKTTMLETTTSKAAGRKLNLISEPIYPAHSKSPDGDKGATRPASDVKTTTPPASESSPPPKQQEPLAASLDNPKGKTTPASSSIAAATEVRPSIPRTPPIKSKPGSAGPHTVSDPEVAKGELKQTHHVQKTPPVVPTPSPEPKIKSPPATKPSETTKAQPPAAQKPPAASKVKPQKKTTQASPSKTAVTEGKPSITQPPQPQPTPVTAGPPPVRESSKGDQPKGKGPGKSVPKQPGKGSKVFDRADTVLNAIQEYQQRKARGESTADALLAGGVTAAANLRGGPAEHLVNFVNAFETNLASGQGKGEASASALGGVGGGFLASKVVPRSPWGLAINMVNTAIKVAEGTQEQSADHEKDKTGKTAGSSSEKSKPDKVKISDISQTVADIEPGSFISSTVTQVARAAYNIFTGDMKALDAQGLEMAAGGAGGPLQGYVLTTALAAEVASGRSLESAVLKVGSVGKGSSLEKIGSALGDETYQFVNKDLPEAAEFLNKDIHKAAQEVQDMASTAVRPVQNMVKNTAVKVNRELDVVKNKVQEINDTANTVVQSTKSEVSAAVGVVQENLNNAAVVADKAFQVVTAEVNNGIKNIANEYEATKAKIKGLFSW